MGDGHRGSGHRDAGKAGGFSFDLLPVEETVPHRRAGIPARPQAGPGAELESASAGRAGAGGRAVHCLLQRALLS